MGRTVGVAGRTVQIAGRTVGLRLATVRPVRRTVRPAGRTVDVAGRTVDDGLATVRPTGPVARPMGRTVRFVGQPVRPGLADARFLGQEGYAGLATVRFPGWVECGGLAALDVGVATVRFLGREAYNLEPASRHRSVTYSEYYWRPADVDIALREVWRQAESIMSKKKGDILEKIVAELHRVPGVHLTRNARLKPLAGKGQGRGREIDVLIEANVAGYEVQIAVECKNKRERVGAPQIDGFAGKLNEVGIPTRHGIFVSASGFTADALQSANAHRIRPLVLTGLTTDGLRSEVGKALCSTVYLLADVVDCAIVNRAPKATPYDLGILYKEGKFQGLILDKFAHLWVQEQIPAVLGRHSVELPIAQGTYQIVEGQKVEVLRITAEIDVVGLVLQMGAKAVQHALIDPLTQSVHKLKAAVTPCAPLSARLSLVVVRTDGDIKRLCMPSESSNVVAYVRLPRIRYDKVYWPLSRRVAAKLRQAVDAYQRGEGPDPSELTFRDIEGVDLAANFEI